MKLFALTFGGVESASTKYRLLQYQSLFRCADIEFEWQEAQSFREFKKLAEFDVVILQKTLLAGNIIDKIRVNARYLIYDADDRIWLRPNKPYSWITRLRIKTRIEKIARVADLCTVANQVIASDIARYDARVKVLPMALDERVWSRISSGEQRKEPDKLTIGWSGAQKNLEFLYQIEPALSAIQQEYTDRIHFLVHCGKAPVFKNLVCEYLPWRTGNEPDAISRFDIGLVPLPADEFARGKSPIKALQYAASNVAIVATPEGAIKEILKNGKCALYASTIEQWENALKNLIDDFQLRRKLANDAYRRFTETYTLEVVFEQMQEILSKRQSKQTNPGISL